MKLPEKLQEVVNQYPQTIKFASQIAYIAAFQAITNAFIQEQDIPYEEKPLSERLSVEKIIGAVTTAIISVTTNKAIEHSIKILESNKRIAPENTNQIEIATIISR